nr:MAG: hypothetical protein 3 [Leviviridae sp.]
MKRLSSLWTVAANELAARCCTSAARDIKTVTSRVENEGDSFLTIVLPTYGKDFERSLDQGRVDSSAFAGFRRGRGPLPLLLGGFLSQVFDSCDGQLLDNPSVDCIFAVRQLTLMFGKIAVPCTPARTRHAIEGYIQCEQEVQEAAGSITEEDRDAFSRVAALLWSDSFSELERRLLADRRRERYLLPRHGPGATADKLRGNAKYNQREWPLRLHNVFPFEEYAVGSLGMFVREGEQSDRVTFLDREAERPVKVITVPKTPKTDRIIAEEPTAMQYMQQALLREFVDVLERDHPVATPTRRAAIRREDHGVGSPITPEGCSEIHCDSEAFEYLPSNFLSFRNQDPNRILAKLGSSSGELATLDMSEASDRVSVRHVEDLLCRWPLLREAVMAVRSSKASVPGKYKHDPTRVVTLSKYASMGSALCFPMEALVFVTAVFVGVEQALSRPLTRKDLKDLVGKVHVFGDDIVCPQRYAESVVRTLEAYGFKVNRSKSFWTGKFRESCGKDYYDGTDITLVRVRRKFPVTRKHVEEVISVVETRNQFYFAGMWETARWLDETIIRKVLKGNFPIVEPTSPVIGRYSSFLRPEASGWDVETHSPVVRGWRSSSKAPSSELDGDGALLKFFLREGNTHPDKEHLERAGRPQSSHLKLRWTRPW